MGGGWGEWDGCGWGGGMHGVDRGGWGWGGRMGPGGEGGGGWG